MAGYYAVLAVLLFTLFLKNRNIISKIKRSKVTDYAALMRNCAPKKAYEIFVLMSSQCTTKLHNRKGRFEFGKVATVMFWGFSTDPHTLVHNNPVMLFYRASFSISLSLGHGLLV